MVEQTVAMTLTAIVMGMSVVAGARALDATAVRTASRAIVELFALARESAAATGRHVAIRFRPASGLVIVHAAGDTLARFDVQERGIRMTATRDSMAYAPSGLGFGAANLRVVLTKGASADTITVSRLGRVKRE